MSQIQLAAKLTYRREFEVSNSIGEFIATNQDAEFTVRPQSRYGSQNPTLFEDAATEAGRPVFKGPKFRHSAPYWWDEVLTVPALKIFSLQNARVFGGTIRSRVPHGFHSKGQLTLRSDLSLFDSSGGIMDGVNSLPSGLLNKIDDANFELSTNEAPVRLDGDHYLIGSVHSHFGHFMLEGLSRLWAAAVLPSDFVKRLKFVVYEPGIPPYARECFRLFGIDLSQIVFCPPHAVVERLIVPAPGYRSHWWAYPEQVRTWDRIANAALGERAQDYPEKIFLSRSKIKERSLDNEAEIEGIFRDAGYTVFSPEDYPLAEQIRMAGSAKAIAGCVGSGLYLAAFQRIAEVPTIVVGPKSFYLKDDALISDIKGGRLIVALGSETDQSDKRAWRADPATVAAALAYASIAGKSAPRTGERMTRNWQDLIVRLQKESPNRKLDKECAEYFGWRVGRNQWWDLQNPPVSPAEDDWAMRQDGREDDLLDQPLPKFTVDLMVGISLGLQAAKRRSSLRLDP